MNPSVHVIDSHTGGEPTRVIISGGPDLGSGTLAEQRVQFDARFDDFRKSVVLEPRGSDVLVGALLCEAHDPANAAGVIFFNNVGSLHMCGHGMIGLVETLAFMQRLKPGDHVIETPVGDVPVTLHGDHRVSLDNVPSYRFRSGVELQVEGFGSVVGDIAWGGNWFFITPDCSIDVCVANQRVLTDYASAIRTALEREGVTGANGGLIDHIEISVPPADPATADCRNFVLCPGLAYDRSPCGTGTSAKLACLAADSKLQPGELWRQESVVGSVFTGSYRPVPAGQEISDADGPSILPTIEGRAYVTGKTELLFEPADPFAGGIN